jgi:hypothetical protein
MTPDELDRILAAEDSLKPSSGFVSGVMEAVREDAAAPPLRFPWLRFSAGVAACGVAAFAGASIPLGPIAPVVGYAAAVLVASLGLASLPRLLDQ